MKCPIRFICISLVVFAVFTGCNSPLSDILPTEPAFWQLEPMGAPLYTYLDSEYNQTGAPNPDPGKTAVFINGNPLAEGVIVLAETSPDGYDDAVRIVNEKDGIVISLFFHKGQRFPWSLEVKTREKEGSAVISQYNWASQKYAVTFDEAGTPRVFDGIRLSSEALTGYTNASLTGEQNARIRHIYTALGIYSGIGRIFSGSQTVLNQNPESLFTAVFTNVAISAFSVTVTPDAPLAVTDAPPGNGSNGLFLGFIVDFFVNLFGGGGSSSMPSVPPAPLPLAVSITKDGIPVDPDTVYYIEKEEDMVFDFSFTNFTANTNVSYVPYDPVKHVYGGYNEYFFSFTQDNGPIGTFAQNYKLIVRRNSYGGTGYFDGKVDFVVFFGQNTVINNNASGIVFQEPDSSNPELNNSIFVFHFTVIEPDDSDNYVFPIHLGVLPPSP